MIYKRIDLYEFRNEFVKFGRDNFSPDGYAVLYDYLNDLVASGVISGGLELDVIAIDCDYVEAPVQEVLEEYGMDRATLEDHTSVLNVGQDRIIYQVF